MEPAVHTSMPNSIAKI